MSNGLSCQAHGHREKRILLRVPADMLAHFDACAVAGYRTRTAELLMRLEASMANESIDEHGVIVVRAPRAAK